MTYDIDQLGGTVAVARMAGVAPPSVTAWRTRGIPADRCPAIERATDGRVTCEELRADVAWQRVPDPAWPHPEGRPCIDVAAPAGQQEVRDAA
jgi:DNA-binding transcriptional regulator YdaS (Cro superfamily)